MYYMAVFLGRLILQLSSGLLVTGLSEKLWDKPRMKTHSRSVFFLMFSVACGLASPTLTTQPQIRFIYITSYCLRHNK